MEFCINRFLYIAMDSIPSVGRACLESHFAVWSAVRGLRICLQCRSCRRCRFYPWVRKMPCRSCRRCRFDPWVRKMPCRRARQPTPVFLLEKPTDRGAWWATVHGVARSRTWLKWLSAHTADKALRPAACLNWSISEQPSISACREMSLESWSWCLSLVWSQTIFRTCNLKLTSLICSTVLLLLIMEIYF